MIKYRLVIVFLMMIGSLSAVGYGQQMSANLPVNTISGKVISVDVESGVISLQTDKGQMIFYLMPISTLIHVTHNMSIVEIEKGDPIFVKYVSMRGKNGVIKLVDNRDE